MPSKRCDGDHRFNKFPPPLSKDYCSPHNAVLRSKLLRPEWRSIHLSPFEKNLYQENPNTAKRPYAAVRDYLRVNGITVTGYGVVPKPVLRLEEASFPKCVEDGARTFWQGAPSPVEAQCWPIALSGRDLLAVTPTSVSRKALAYILPAIAHVCQQPTQQCGRGPIALVLAPTRELAEQIHQIARQLEPHTGVRSICIVGGRPKEAQREELGDGCGICVATPRRLLHLLEESELSLLRCTYLVLDEADRMMLIGLGTYTLAIAGQIRPDRQTLVFTTSWLGDVRAFALPLLCNYIEASFSDPPAPCGSLCIDLVTHVCDVNGKDDTLMTLLEDSLNEELLKTVVIANGRPTIDGLVMKMLGRGWAAVGFYGRQTRNKRDWLLSAFRSGAACVLVGTPAATHDLVLEGVRIVVNFDVAKSSMEYRHRMRLAASSSEVGSMHTLVGPEDSRYVKELISFLRETNQKVDPKLIRVSADKIRGLKIVPKCSCPRHGQGNPCGC